MRANWSTDPPPGPSDVRGFAASFLIAAGLPVHAFATPSSTPPAASPTDDIVVTAPALQCTLSGRHLGNALKTYRAGRSLHAPASTLYFEVRPAARRMGLGARLALRAKGAVVPIVPDAERRFVLPKLSGEDWELVGDCYDGALAISPLVMSPGTSAADRRLGDMRVQCDVSWQIVQETMSAARGVFVDAIGGCKSSQTAIYASSARPVAQASVVDGAVTRPVPISADRMSYSVPLYDKRLPDSARVRFRFE